MNNVDRSPFCLNHGGAIKQAADPPKKNKGAEAPFNSHG